MMLSRRFNVSTFNIAAVSLLLAIWLYKFSIISFRTASISGQVLSENSGRYDPNDDYTGGSITEPSTSIRPKPPQKGTELVSQKQATTSHKQKTVIVGKLKTDDINWILEQLQDWRSAIYAVDDSDSTDYLHTLVNKGKESMPYLTYLIDYYDDLSDVNVFVHAHGGGYPVAWHNEPIGQSNYSASVMLKLLRIDNVLARGYVNLRCNGIPGCPGELHPKNKSFRKDAIEIGFKKFWAHMYGSEKDLPKLVGVACCAQFAVSKERVRQHPKDYYIKAREWLIETEENDEGSGRVFEYFWHIMFGMPAVHCEGDYHACMCRTYDCGE